MTDDGTLQDATQRLHATFKLTIRVAPSTPPQPPGIAWSCTLHGQDMLDGYWQETRSGVARNHGAALRAAGAAFAPRRRWWRMGR